ncbi:MAG: M23 family metallopeptidase [Alistipes sp.]|jgi:murein DD-endopeptidase MepM/ murein hydrolase activator NlpD|nr:M23 family metallopeptidase [Alistipes sp.]
MNKGVNEKYRNKVVRRRFWRQAMPVLYKGLVWAAMIIGWYVIFALVVDMPKEHRLRHSVDNMRVEYDKLEQRYKILSRVLDNVVERDKSVFRKLFQSDPYVLNAGDDNLRQGLKAQLMEMSNEDLQEVLNSMVKSAGRDYTRLVESYEEFGDAVVHDHMKVVRVPSIQPVNNAMLTLLAAGKKPLINPFHRTMNEHHGVDYLVPEGTAVFATADGRVESLSEKNTTEGKSIFIDHGNGYKTRYSHLLDIRVSEGDVVRRGDIIALSGNSGLSFAPHLHYEVSLYGTRVDPVHYFFMELNADDYQRIINIALSSMQSFD